MKRIFKLSVAGMLTCIILLASMTGLAEESRAGKGKSLVLTSSTKASPIADTPIKCSLK